MTFLGKNFFDVLACLWPNMVESGLCILVFSIVKSCGSPLTVGFNRIVFGELTVRLVDFGLMFGALGTPHLLCFEFN